ncbi:hypothetical protein P154DRAFT_577710 [Amniculicola lignicola CBS 123094]|uniref:Uncharacterized protein n=1 Tax=Amniculicola lignicola CBS 123094 TaxID=1392246 RepID=A0A6A5WHH3_9PLEO|nr:hypothetical protein P154DRAFT_577710 [Amniculicola lignicola CBS 123094]
MQTSAAHTQASPKIDTTSHFDVAKTSTTPARHHHHQQQWVSLTFLPPPLRPAIAVHFSTLVEFCVQAASKTVHTHSKITTGQPQLSGSIEKA